MNFSFDYKEYNIFEKSISPLEEKVIKDLFEIVIKGNSSFNNMSSPELENVFWNFRHGWILRSMLI